jgi:predicted  nucleic acid-binding Zn-ribbon protein
MSAQPSDNYDAFLSRLDAATSSLNARAAALDKGLAAVSLLVGPFESGVRNWEERRHYVSGQLARHAGTPQSYTALSELRDVAVKMESMIRGRLRNVQEKLAVMQDRREAIHASLLELELSRKKLQSSRLLSQDREKLSTIFASLAGSTVAVSALPDTGLLGDLREAREAIILAEALMELKGY